MYNSSNVPVDKGLGFDFSQISDMVKGVATVGLNVFNNQMQIKQIQAMGQRGANQGWGMPNPGQYGQPFGMQYGGNPSVPVYGFQPNIPQPYISQQQSSMFNTTTMLMLGGLAVGGIFLFKMFKG